MTVHRERPGPGGRPQVARPAALGARRAPAGRGRARRLARRPAPAPRMSRPGAALPHRPAARDAGAPRRRVRGDVLRAAAAPRTATCTSTSRPSRCGAATPSPPSTSTSTWCAAGPAGSGSTTRTSSPRTGCARLSLRPGPARRRRPARRSTPPCAPGGRRTTDAPRAWFEVLDAVARCLEVTSDDRSWPARSWCTAGCRACSSGTPAGARRERAGVAGWVTNAADGTVHAHFEGPGRRGRPAGGLGAATAPARARRAGRRAGGAGRRGSTGFEVR